MSAVMPVIQGAKKGGGRAAVEEKDTLRSTQTAQVLDLWCEGEVQGLVNGLKSVYLDGVPLQNADGSMNFENVQFAWTPGTQGQGALPGIDEVQNEVAVGVAVPQATPVVRTITDAGVDAVRVTLSVPQLTFLDAGTGDLRGAEFEYTIEVQSNGGGFVERVHDTVKGKATSVYSFEKKIELSGPPPWDVRVTRVTADAATSALNNAFNWASYTEIQQLKLRYPNSAMSALQVSAQQFNRIPTRAFDMLALRVQVPTNYDPMTRVYTGTWDGTFKIAWTDNPAWVFREVATHPRWGLGGYLAASQLNKWRLYTIAQYCDAMVPDGKGGMEPRFTCNLYLQTRADARKVMQDLAAVFRAITFWAGAELQVMQDAPSDPVMLFTPANVVGGAFNYQQQSGLQRHSVFIVSYNDLGQLGKRVPEVYAPDDLVARYGIRELALSPIGVWSRGQAQRLARWAAYSEEMEGETVSFRVAAEGAVALPGQVFQVQDPNESGERLGGRIHAATASQVQIDAPVVLAAGESYTLTVQLADPSAPNAYKTEVRAVTTVAGTTSVLDVSPPFSVAPPAEGAWLLESDQVVATLWRCLGVIPVQGQDQFEISGVAHHPGKYDLIEQGITLQGRPISRLKLTPPAPATLALLESPYQAGSLTRSRVSASWPTPAQGLLYLVSWRLNNGPWTDLPPTSANCVDIEDLAYGQLEVTVRSRNALGNESPSISATELVDGVVGTEPLAGTALAAANAAAAAASAAQTSANDANAALANIASDNLLTPGEKPQVVRDYSVITTEQAGIDAQAVNYAVTTEKTTYDTAVSDLTSYLAGLTTPVHWDDLGGDTTIVGATFRSKFIAVYIARQACLDRISANAKARLGGLATKNTVDTTDVSGSAINEEYVLFSAGGWGRFSSGSA